MAYWEKEIRGLMGKAVHRYGLIQDGDQILVGVSGGKDSLTLLQLLHERRKRVQTHYELIPVHIDLGFDSQRANILKDFFEGQGFSYHIEFTDIGKRANSPENRENPCFLCSWERRKLIFQLAHRLKCNKIALGHHKDDIIETLLLNIFYSGEISSMLPIQSLFKGKITLIRPLALMEEKKIERFAREMNLPFGPSGCPSSGRTKRKEMKELVETLGRKNRKVKGNIFRSLSNVKLDYMLWNK
ncbi:MAG: tRNA 2-thiocytidine(32) synthetase TtcA [Deltaproteobacteria bacterium RBG_16_47_11]|nr:MAG: tRNA 2-thiocytidine(32) synthetase TtcA [Deltaproteobacteria bacterium RBG_16_47_11]